MNTLRDDLYNAILQPDILHAFRQEQLWKLIQALSQERKVRYARHRQRKYGNINKGFTKLELQAFFTTSMHSTARLAFLTMLMLGLRIGEVVRLQRHDLDLSARRLYLALWNNLDLCRKAITCVKTLLNGY